MPKIPDCDGLRPAIGHRCQRYSFTPSLVCAVHPSGPDSEHCLDFAPNAGTVAEELWEPDGTMAYYAGVSIPESSCSRLTREEQIELLETHPLFTCRCFQCGHKAN